MMICPVCHTEYPCCCGWADILREREEAELRLEALRLEAEMQSEKQRECGEDDME